MIAATGAKKNLSDATTAGSSTEQVSARSPLFSGNVAEGNRDA
jgi:hypothetical protein